MANLGSPNATKDNLRISGNVVIAGLQVSGVVLNVQISGETIYVATSGTPIQVVTPDGGWVNISGTIGQSISGASQSGMVVWGAGISGQIWVQTQGSDFVAVSGIVSLASGIQINVSGQPVFAYISGGSVNIANGWSISNADYKISSNVQGLVVMSSPVISAPTYFQRALLHLSSTQTTSSEFAVYHNSFIGTGLYSTKIFSQNMSGHKDVIYLPSAPYAVFPGATISMEFMNSGALTLIMQEMFTINP